MRRHGASSPVDSMAPTSREGSKTYLAFPWSRGGAAPAYVEELDGVKNWLEKTKDRCGAVGGAVAANHPERASGVLAGVPQRTALLEACHA